MNAYALAAVIFVCGYLANVTMISVFYPRALAHGAVRLRPVGRFIVAHLGMWVTGLDPKGWVCMHRMHHLHSDTPDDPHSPQNVGIIGVALAQLRSYEKVLKGLHNGREPYTSLVRDLDIPTSWAMRHGLWFAPYLLHLGVATGLAWLTASWLVGLAYFAGLMSHPVQGWMVNGFGHAVGYRNYPLDDSSRNNTLVAWLVFGEGYQNNHHRYPASAQFAHRWFEVDFGFVACVLMAAFGIVSINVAGAPRAAEVP